MNDILQPSMAADMRVHGVSKTALRDHGLPIPCLPEQAALEAKPTKARQVKQGMMQELLTGKTRLV